MKANQEVIEKLKKILTLANDKGAQPGEIEAAFAKAKALAMRHAIDIGGIDLTDRNTKAPGMEINRVDSPIRSQKVQKYHRWICSVLQEVFGISVVRIWNMGYRYVFIGEATDVAICQLLFPWLEDVFYSTYNKGARSGMFPRNAASKNGCYMGLYRGMVQANKRAEESFSAEDRSKWALVVVNKEALVKARVAEEFPELRQARQSSFRTSNAALDHGFTEGKKINLHQMPGAAEKKRIG